MKKAPEAGHRDSADLLNTVSDPVGSEDSALALLKRHNLSPGVLEQLSKNTKVMKDRRIMLGVAQHPQTPRRVSLLLLRHLFTFELVQVALSAATPGDIKKSAEHALIGRLESLSLGETLALARRAPGNVAAELLFDREPGVARAALENARLTEESLVKAILHTPASAALVQAVCQHAKWPLRREVRIALLRNEYTPLARALEFARGLPASLVADILGRSKLPGQVKAALLEGLRSQPGRPSGCDE